MATSFQKSLFLLLVVMAAAVLYRPAEVTAMQLEDADELNGATDDEAASFSEMDADALADKLDTEDDPSAGTDDEELNDEEDQDDAEPEAQSFFEGDEEEEFAEDELDLSQMSDDDAAAVMEMLSPEEQKAFKDMLEEHKNSALARDAEL